MTEFESKLNNLIEILISKRDLLLLILNITENQETLLTSESDLGEFFYEMNDIKQTNINKIIELDVNFNKVFLEIPDFEEKSKGHLDKIKEMQDLIKEVTSLDNSIRDLEENNKKFSHKIPKIDTLPQKRRIAIAKDLLNKYKKSQEEI